MLRITTAALGLALSVPSLAQEPQTADQSCRAAFAAFQSGDVEALLERFPTDDELRALSGADDVTATRAKAEELFRRRFEEARNEALGWFDLEAARYVGVLSAPISATDLPTIEPLEFLVTDGQRLWAIGGNDVARTARGWSFIEFLCVRGRFDPREAYEPVLTDEALEELEEARADLEFSKVEASSLRRELEHFRLEAIAERAALEEEHRALELRVAELRAALDEERAAREADAYDATLALRRVEIQGLAVQAKLEREREASPKAPTTPRSPEERVAEHERVLAMEARWEEGALMPNEVLEYLRWNQDVKWIVSPSLQAELDGRDDFVQFTGTRIGDLAASVAGGVAATDEGIVLARGEELDALVERLRAAPGTDALELRLRDRVVFPSYDAGQDVRTIFEQCGLFAEFEVAIDDMLETQPRHISGRIESRGGLSIWSLLSLISFDAGLTFRVEGDTLIVTSRGW